MYVDAKKYGLIFLLLGFYQVIVGQKRPHSDNDDDGPKSPKKLRFSPENLLYNYAALNDLKGLEEALKNNQDVDESDNRDQTALHHAARKGHIECLKMLLAAGADVDKQDSKGHTPLYYAMEKTTFGKHALANKHICATLLLQAKAKTEILSKPHDWRPLHDAVWNQDPTFISLLLEHGADINAVDKYGHTPLLHVHKGAYRSNVNHVQCLKILIWHGLDNINAQDENGKTALHDAVKAEHIDCIKLLLLHGSDLTIKDVDAKSPLDYANEPKSALETKPRIKDMPALIAEVEKQRKEMLKAQQLAIADALLTLPGANDVSTIINGYVGIIQATASSKS